MFAQGSRYIGDFGSIMQWQKVEATFAGPDSGVTANPNPFLIDVDVKFTGPSGAEQQVNAFYDGDGVGGTSGDQWKVRFSSGQVGEWMFRTSSTEGELDDYVGTFRIVPGDSSQADFYQRGMLLYSGEHYLRFADGSHWVKSGIDDPENFLGNAVGDWQAKRNYIDYLASVGVNSIYMITNNVGGDRNSDTFPFWGANANQVRSGSNGKRYNVAKLLEWENMFSYIQSRGLVLHIVLHDDSGSVFSRAHQLLQGDGGAVRPSSGVGLEHVGRNQRSDSRGGRPDRRRAEYARCGQLFAPDHHASSGAVQRGHFRSSRRTLAAVRQCAL